jgi:hypothetical protein
MGEESQTSLRKDRLSGKIALFRADSFYAKSGGQARRAKKTHPRTSRLSGFVPGLLKVAVKAAIDVPLQHILLNIVR